MRRDSCPDFHRRLAKRLDLRWIFCLEAERVVSNDRVIRFENRFLQLQPKRNQGLGAGARVIVQQAREGELRVVYQDREVAFERIARPWPKERPAAGPRVVKGARPPAAEHPWKRYPAVEKRIAEKAALTRDGLWK
jgi:hypothetical protein